MSEAQEGKDPRARPPNRARYLGFALLAFAFLAWALVPVALFLPPTAGQKGWMTAALLVVGETAFWVSAVILGREVVRHYRACLDPRRLFRSRSR